MDFPDPLDQFITLAARTIAGQVRREAEKNAAPVLAHQGGGASVTNTTRDDGDLPDAVTVYPTRR